MATKAELIKQRDELQARIDAMPDSPELNGRALDGESIFYLNDALEISDDVETGSVSDEWFYTNGNYYLSESVAKRATDYYKKWGQFNRVAFELMEGEPELNWMDDSQTKHYAYYSHESNQWLLGWTDCWNMEACNHVFARKESAQRLVDWANENMPEG